MYSFKKKKIKNIEALNQNNNYKTKTMKTVLSTSVPI